MGANADSCGHYTGQALGTQRTATDSLAIMSMAARWFRVIAGSSLKSARRRPTSDATRRRQEGQANRQLNEQTKASTVVANRSVGQPRRGFEVLEVSSPRGPL